MPASRVKNTDRILITGPVLLGFGTMFDRSFGDPKTPRPYPRVTPSAMGGVLLPFPCPHCNAARSEVVDPKTRLGWYDHDRKFSWCPACHGRYVINPEGVELKEGTTVGCCAPALVEHKGEKKLLKPREKAGLDLLGVS